MAAVSTQPQFGSWFRGNWFRVELLARRHRSDHDPFPDILLRLQHRHPCAESVSNAVTVQPLKRAAKLKTPLIPTPASIQGKVKALLETIGADEELLKLVDVHVDDVSYQVECRQADKLIIQRQLTGPPCTPGVAHIRGKVKGGNIGAKRLAPSSGDVQPYGMMFPSSQLSQIEQIVRKPPAPAPKGKGDHLPREKQKYCEYCNRWIEKGSFGQHCKGEKHNENEVSMRRSSSKCTRNNLFSVDLSAYACCRHVVRKVCNGICA
jgi:hypothetical protein